MTHPSGDAGSDPLALLARGVDEYFPADVDRKSASVLVLGARAGTLVRTLLAGGFDVYVLDEDSQAVSDLRLNFGYDQAGFSGCFGAFAGLPTPFPSRFFHVVLDAGCLHHAPLEEVLQVYRLLPDMLRPSGLFLGLVPARTTVVGPGWISLDAGTYIRHDGHGPHLLRVYAMDEAKRLLAGFADAQCSAVSAGGLSLWLLRGRVVSA